MAKDMKIFMGADKYGEDFPALRELRKKSERQGFVGFRHTNDVTEALGDFGLYDKKAVLRGAYTKECVADVGRFFLEQGVDQLTIDLPNCRSSRVDTENSERIIASRKNDVVEALGEKYQRDKRVVFIEK